MTVETSQTTDTLVAKPADLSQQARRVQADRNEHQVIERIDQTLDLIAEATNVAVGLYPADQFDVSIIIPVHNHRESLPVVLERIWQVMPVTTETILVDDGSTDGTAEWLATLPKRDNLKIIGRRTHHGKGSAIRLGIRHCSGRVIAFQEGDLQCDPVDLLRVIWPVLDGDAEVVYGSRYLYEADPISPIDRVGNLLLTSASNLLTGLRLTDMETRHKAFDAELLRSLVIREPDVGFEAEITAKIAHRKARMIEVPTRSTAPVRTDCKTGAWRNWLNTMKCVWKYRRG